MNYDTLFLSLHVAGRMNFPGGGVTLTWYTCMYIPFGVLFCVIWYSDRGFLSPKKVPNLHKLGVFWANYCLKKHPIWAKLGVFRTKLVYWWMLNWDKNKHSESQNFKVGQAYPRRKIFEEPPLPRVNFTYKTLSPTQKTYLVTTTWG